VKGFELLRITSNGELKRLLLFGGANIVAFAAPPLLAAFFQGLSPGIDEPFPARRFVAALLFSVSLALLLFRGGA